MQRPTASRNPQALNVQAGMAWHGLQVLPKIWTSIRLKREKEGERKKEGVFVLE
jgi:hypothetical protein